MAFSLTAKALAPTSVLFSGRRRRTEVHAEAGRTMPRGEELRARLWELSELQVVLFSLFVAKTAGGVVAGCCEAVKRLGGGLVSAPFSSTKSLAEMFHKPLKWPLFAQPRGSAEPPRPSRSMTYRPTEELSPKRFARVLEHYF